MAFRFYDVESRSSGLNQNGGWAVVHAHDDSKTAVLAMDASRLSVSLSAICDARCEMRDVRPAKGQIVEHSEWLQQEERRLCFVSSREQKMDSRKAAMVGLRLGRYG